MFLELLRNAAILMAFCMTYALLFRSRNRNTPSGRLILGIIFGLAAAFGMLNPTALFPGILIDSRSIFISMAGLLGGGLSVLIAVPIALVCRMILGGTGAPVGYAIILTAALLGLGGDYLHRKKHVPITKRNLYVFGVIVHIDMMLLMLALPSDIRWRVIETITLPVLFIYPIGVVLVGRLLLGEDERTSTERALRDSEESLSITLNSIGDGVVVADVAGRITHMNPVAVHLTGWSLADAVGHPAEEVFHLVNVQTRQKVENPGQKALQAGTIVRLANQTVLISRDGTEAHIADSASPMHNAEGKIAGAVVVFRDVTELYGKEEAIRKSERKYRTFFENSTDAMLIIEKGQFIDCNAATVGILGYASKADILNTHPSKLSPEFQPDGQLSFDKVEKLMVQAHERGSHQFEWIHLRKDGSEIPIEVSLTVIESETGIQLHTIWRDLTTRWQSQKALRQSEARLASILNVAPVGIGVVKNRILDQVNARICEMTGYHKEELIGKRSRILYATEDEFLRVGKEKYNQIQKDGAGTVETQWQCKNGAVIEVLLSSTPVNEEDLSGGVTFTALDITARTRIISALRASESKYRALVESTSDWIWEVDKNGTYTYASPQVETILGYKPEEVVGKTPFDLMLPEEADRFQAIIRQMMNEANPIVALENVTLHKNGHEVVLETSGVPILDSDGQGVGYRGVDRDITERRRSELALRESTQKLALHVERTPLAVVGWDLDFKVSEWNPAAEEMFGYSREEALGQHAKFIVPEDYQAQINEVWRGLVSQAGGTRSTNANITKDGQTIFCEWYNTSLVDNKGNAIGAASLVMDVTARKQAEEERARLMMAIEQSAEIVMITDADANIQYVNPSFEKVTGYSRAEMIGQNPRILQSGQHSAAFYRKMWNVLTAGNAWSGQLINKKKDGTVYTEDAIISPVMTQGGKIINYVGATHDATHELELEAQLRQAQKMEAVGQMAGGIAHDFNNLLQVISGYVELSEMSLKPDDEHASAITQIGTAAQRGKRLINQLLAFSRRQVIRPIDFNLNELIEPLLKMMRGLIGEHIELNFNAGRELGIIYADQGLVEQVLMNLCVNARDAMPEGGKLVIETENILIDNTAARMHTWATPGRYVLLSVTDTGSGMDNETLDRIFEPFFTTKEVGKGTGLGLSTVFGIIKQHDGHITACSEIGQGTIFKIYLPSVERNAAVISREPLGPVIGGTETILVAEDDETVLILAEHLLTDAGYTVLTAIDGEDAIRVFEEHVNEIDAVMFDVVMPRLGGKQALERILELRPGLPHLFASGYSENAVHTNFIQKCGLHLLSKPYQTETLLRKIREVLDEK